MKGKGSKKEWWEQIPPPDDVEAWRALPPDVLAAYRAWSDSQPGRREVYLDLGRAMIARGFRRVGQEFSEQQLKVVLKSFNCATVEDLFLAVTQGSFIVDDVVLAVFPTLEIDNNFVSLGRRRRRIAEKEKSGYTGPPPSSETDDTSSQLRMRDDFNTSLNAAVKVARTEVLARLVDLNNPALPQDERLRRARRLVRSYQRRRAENPNFPTSPEVRAAFSIINRDNYQRRKVGQKAKLAM